MEVMKGEILGVWIIAHVSSGSFCAYDNRRLPLSLLFSKASIRRSKD